MKIYFYSIVACLVLHLADSRTTEAQSKSTESTRQKIEAALAERHPTQGPTWWRALGPEGLSDIQKLYESTNSTYERSRLIEGAGWLGTSESNAWVKQQAGKSQDLQIKMAALRTVGTTQGAKELFFLSQFLTHRDPQVRLVAAETIQKMDDKSARAKLEDFKKNEAEAWLINRLEGKVVVPDGIRLDPVASSDETIEAQKWVGTWQGVLIETRTDRAPVVTPSVVLKLVKTQGNQLAMEGKFPIELLPLSITQGKVGGQAHRSAVKNAPAGGVTSAVVGTVKDWAKNEGLMNLEFPAFSMVFVGTRTLNQSRTSIPK